MYSSTIQFVVIQYREKRKQKSRKRYSLDFRYIHCSVLTEYRQYEYSYGVRDAVTQYITETYYILVPYEYCTGIVLVLVLYHCTRRL